MTSGIVVVDKPKGPTSHDVVAQLRKKLGTRQVGHAGTLDPMATGVLVVAVDEATKLVPWLTADDKTYEATIRLGVTTDSLDADGRETERREVELDDEKIARAIAAEAARTQQIPPAVSAIRIGGERSHDLARRGEAPEHAPREVAVRSLVLAGSDTEHLRVVLEVSKGYFVRSLARDLAAALGTVGHLTALRRTRSGAFTVGEAVALEAVTESAIIPLDRAAARVLPVSTLTDAGILAASHGKRVPAEDLRDPHGSPSAWLDSTGRLVAVGETLSDGTGRVLRGFPVRATS